MNNKTYLVVINTNTGHTRGALTIEEVCLDVKLEINKEP